MGYTTLNIMAERVLRILEAGGVGRDQTWDKREIAADLRDNSLFVMKGEWFESRKRGDNIIPAHYVGSFENIPIKKNGDQEYIDLPAPRVDLPDEGGVQRVRPYCEDGIGKAMIPIPMDFMDVIGKLPTAYLEDNRAYYATRDKIIFYKKDGCTLEEEEINSVNVDLVTISPTDVGLNDPFPAPPELIKQIIANTLQVYGMVQKPQDILLDENPNN